MFKHNPLSVFLKWKEVICILLRSSLLKPCSTSVYQCSAVCNLQNHYENDMMLNKDAKMPEDENMISLDVEFL